MASVQSSNDCSFRYHLIWLDQHLTSSSNKRKLERLRELDPDIKGFTCKEQCLKYIVQQNDRNTMSYIIFITSGAFCKEIIPEIENYNCIRTIFIFCANIENYVHLNYQKLRAICGDTYELIDRIDMFIQKNTNDIEFNLFHNQSSSQTDLLGFKTKSKDENAIRNVIEDQARFLWLYLGHKFMIQLENDDDQKAKNEMTSLWRKTYKADKDEITIDDFIGQSLDDNAENIIRWYTKKSFVYRCVNQVLRQENISEVYSHRYFVKLMCHQLEKLHPQFIKEEKTSSLRLFRGQSMKLEDVQLLKKNVGNIISLSGFISTARKKSVAIEFIKNHSKQGQKSVLLEIEVDVTSKHSVPFAEISQFSEYPEEREVLFSIGAIFHIESFQFDEEQELYIVRLMLRHHDQLIVRKYIDQTYAKHIDSNEQSVLFGKLLCEMEEYESAITYFLHVLRHLSDRTNQFRPVYLNNIGVCYNEMGNRGEALKYYQQACCVYEQRKNERGISACQHNIASIYHAQGDQAKALPLALKAFDGRQDNKIEKASTLNLLGCIQLALHDVDAAHDKFQEALQLRLKYLGKINSNHPDIGISHQNLGKVCFKQRNLADAEFHYKAAAKIFHHNYPESHQMVIDINNCLKEIKRK